MREGTEFWVRIGAFAFICASAQALALERSPNEYDTIAKRNIFNLKEQEPPKIAEPTPLALPKIYLTGITAGSNEKLAFLKTQPLAKPGGPASEQYLMLKVGQKENDIELLEIDEKSGRVKISHAGTVMELTFEKDAPKSNPAGNVIAQKGPASNPSTSPTAQSVAPNPAVAPPPGTYPVQRKLPARTLPAPMPPLPTTPTPAAEPPSQALPAPAIQKEFSPEEQQQLINELERSNPRR